MLFILIQSMIIVVLALIRRRALPQRHAGIVVLIAVASLLGASFGALSNGLALLARREETLIAVMNFLLLPLTFLSAAFMQQELMPSWMQSVADVQPGQLGGAGRAGGVASAHGLEHGGRPDRPAGGAAGDLHAFATRAFRSYQRSV